MSDIQILLLSFPQTKMKHHNTFNPAEGSKTLLSQSTDHRLPCFSVPSDDVALADRNPDPSSIHSIHCQNPTCNSLLPIHLCKSTWHQLKCPLSRFALAAHTSDWRRSSGGESQFAHTRLTPAISILALATPDGGTHSLLAKVNQVYPAVSEDFGLQYTLLQKTVLAVAPFDESL